MAKKPTFKLYRIVDKKTGKAFCSWGVGNRPYMTELGNFFRTPEKIREHLRWLTYDMKKSRRYHEGKLIEGYYDITPEKPNPELVSRYYVECYSVLQLNLYTQEASEYLGLAQVVA